MSRFRSSQLAFLILFFSLMVRPVNAQEGVQEFEQKIKEWREIVVELVLVRQEYLSAASRELAAEKKTQFESLKAKGEQKIEEIKIAATKAYLESPKKGSEYHQFLTNVLQTDIHRDENMTSAFRIAEALDSQKIDQPELAGLVGMAMFSNQQFERALELFKANATTSLSAQFLGRMEFLKQKWKDEQERRAKDKDLPRAIVETTKGKFVIELLEDDAPNTVANFVKLAEDGYYDGLEFFAVKPTRFAMVGSQTNGQITAPKYLLKNEGQEVDTRPLFRGYVSAVVLENKATLHDSLFMINFRPTLDSFYDNNLSFGRVIKGMAVVDKINRSHDKKDEPNADFQPDKIVKITIENKRDHDYEPKIIR